MRMTLAKLIEAVEAGTATGGPDAMVVPFEMGELIQIVTGDDDALLSDFVEAHDGSVDAAKRLHDALLPGWHLSEMHEAADPGEYPGQHWLAVVARRKSAHAVEANASDPARAWLLAVLRALEQEGRDGPGKKKAPPKRGPKSNREVGRSRPPLRQP